jgi:hypothetical protein
MEKHNEFELTNELLEQVLGGVSRSPFKKIYTFTGKYAAQQALELEQSTLCGCSCQCNDTNGSGGGAGAGA